MTCFAIETTLNNWYSQPTTIPQHCLLECCQPTMQTRNKLLFKQFGFAVHILCFFNEGKVRCMIVNLLHAAITTAGSDKTEVRHQNVETHTLQMKDQNTQTEVVQIKEQRMQAESMTWQQGIKTASVAVIIACTHYLQ